jgi:hypothetical protein
MSYYKQLEQLLWRYGCNERLWEAEIDSKGR